MYAVDIALFATVASVEKIILRIDCIKFMKKVLVYCAEAFELRKAY
jgi:hypothetical protein